MMMRKTPISNNSSSSISSRKHKHVTNSVVVQRGTHHLLTLKSNFLLWIFMIVMMILIRDEWEVVVCLINWEVMVSLITRE